MPVCQVGVVCRFAPERLYTRAVGTCSLDWLGSTLGLKRLSGLANTYIWIIWIRRTNNEWTWWILNCRFRRFDGIRNSICILINASYITASVYFPAESRREKLISTNRDYLGTSRIHAYSGTGGHHIIAERSSSERSWGLSPLKISRRNSSWGD